MHDPFANERAQLARRRAEMAEEAAAFNAELARALTPAARLAEIRTKIDDLRRAVTVVDRLHHLDDPTVKKVMSRLDRIEALLSDDMARP